MTPITPPVSVEEELEATLLTEANVLAGCMAIAPHLFLHGLDGTHPDGPVTKRRMADTIEQVRMVLFAAQYPLPIEARASEPTKQHRFGAPPEPVVNPSEAWCDAYADWYYQGSR